MSRRPTATRSPLRVERLEDRTVPTTFTVTTLTDVVNPSDGKLSLREAVTRANAHPGADTIVLPAGTCRISLAGAGEDGNATGDLDVTDAVTIQGAGAGVSVVDGQQLDRVFDVGGASRIRVVLQGLTVTNGKVTGDGGGVRLGNADMVLRDAVVAGNRASVTGGGVSNNVGSGQGSVSLVRTTVARNVAGTSGGGIQVGGLGSVLTARDSTVRRNVAGTAGGGAVAATATLTNSTVSGNTALGGDGGGLSALTATLTGTTVSGNGASASGTGNGGGVAATTATLTNSTVSGNSAGGSGGGLNATTATLTDSTVAGNSAGGNGGGIGATTATLTNCTVSGNTAGADGGGIFVGTATLTNCTVSGNTTPTVGGGVWAVAGTLTNCTVVENTARNGGGVFYPALGTLTVRNTIIALNLVDFAGSDPDVLGAFTSSGHNLIGDPTGGTGFTNGVGGDLVGTAVNPLDPKIGALASNGGLTQTHALLAGSPAIDAGDNALLPPTDQRGVGFPRRKDGDGNGSKVVDIGAFEF